MLSSHWGPPVPVSMGFFPLPGRGQWAGTCWWGGAGIALSPTQAFTTPSPGFPVCEFSCSLRVPMPPSRPAHRKFHVRCSWKGGSRGPDTDAQVLGAYCLQWPSVSVRISGKTGQWKWEGESEGERLFYFKELVPFVVIVRLVGSEG